MATTTKSSSQEGAAHRGYADLQDHIKALDQAGLLRTIDQPVNKDTEMHPLVRWQFRGGIPEAERKAFLFTNITDAKGRKYDMPVVIGALAANRQIYSVGMGVEVDEIGARWTHAIANPIEPNIVEGALCQEVVLLGAEIDGPGKGLDALPVPISTPGFDCAPYLTATNVTTRDPETGIQNMGTYRCGLKSSNRLGIRMATRIGGAGGYYHWQKYQALGQKMPCAIVLGGPPAVAYVGPQKLHLDADELAVAGGIVGAPINAVKAKTVDLLVPAEAEIVIEGWIDTEYLEPEAPFGESHGYIALEDYNPSMEVTAITRRNKPVLPSIISQVTPSESSVVKRVAYEPMYMAHLRDNLGIQGVLGVSMHEPLTNIRTVVFVKMAPGSARTEIWRALYGAATLRADTGKYVIAINDDIDPDNGDAVFWALSYRANPARDIEVLPHRGRGHGPRTSHEEATLLIDATRKGDMPPLALPKREFMENAQALWERLGLPPLKPEQPWHGYDLGDWTEDWEAMAKRAVAGDYLENGLRTAQRRRKGLTPQTPVGEVEGPGEESES